MKLLLVLASDDSYAAVSPCLKPLGFELIRYRHVLKAMDNLDEIDPTGIIISANDFPRHWKAMTQFVRSERSKTDCPIVILKGKTFPEDDAAKAAHLGINGLVFEDLNDPAEVQQIQGILARYVSVNDKRQNRRYPAQEWTRFGFVFSHPIDAKIITGEVKTVSTTGISFAPALPSLVDSLDVGVEIPDCSLRIGEEILSPGCALRHTGTTIAMEFLSFPEGEKTKLETYLEKLPMEELKAKHTSKT